MDKLRLILIAITIVINVAPIAAVLLIYRNNLLGLVVSSELSDIVNDSVIPEDPLGNLTLLNSTYDADSRTITLTFEFTNPLEFDLSINSMSADVQCAVHDFPLGNATISNPVEIDAGKTAIINVIGTWSKDAVNHVSTAHGGAQKIDIELTGISVNVNGISIQTNELVKIPDFPVA